MSEMTDYQRESFARHLRTHLRGEVRFDSTTRKLYSTDASIYQIEPLGVVLPKTAQDLVSLTQICAETGVSITSRGGGTSLSGQSIGPGLVADCSKHLHHILELDPAQKRVRVQPGVVLDQLNRAAAAHGLQFGPEVATASRACLGGMIGNNSAGSRSLVYGKTIDHVHALNVVLANGEMLRAGPVNGAEWKEREKLGGAEASLYRAVRQIAGSNRDEIQKRFPNIIRRVSGYNLDRFAGDFEGGAKLNLSHLLVGSEGTLGVTTEAELALIDRPTHRGLLVPHFSSLAAAMQAVAACLAAKPSAVELLDHLFVKLARNNLALKEQLQAIEGTPEALLMVEFCGEDPREVEARIEKLQAELQGVNGITAIVKAIDPCLRDPLWNLRNSSVPLLYSIPGKRKPVTFVEDTAVSPERLPEFVERFREILHQHGTDGAFYGHASVGCLHIRPLLDLKEPGEVATMQRIMEAITDLVLEFGGALSGEHGDGLVRSAWNEKMFGPEVYKAFCDIKAAFDPRALLNPGKVVHAPSMVENLRYPASYRTREPRVLQDYSKQEGFTQAIEICNGSGACRKMQGGAMCPSFRATRDERDSTRGRANALRLALSGEKPLEGVSSRWVADVMDLCLSCKACKSECPSNVDLAKLKAEFLQLFYDRHRRPLGHHLLANVNWLYRIGAMVAPLANHVQAMPVVRGIMQIVAGIDRRRSLPRLHSEHFSRWFARHEPAEAAGRLGQVTLLADCFTSYTEPQIGSAAVMVLERAGYSVRLLEGICCGRAMLSKGFLRRAKSHVRRAVPRVARQLRPGEPLLGIEPSCLVSFIDEWPDLDSGSDARRIASQAELVDVWIARAIQTNKSLLQFQRREGACLLHVHCHQRAWRGIRGSVSALSAIPGLEPREMDAGCCGMAGSFGYEVEHYPISARIAELQLLPQIRARPDALLAATGTSCRHQIHDLAGRKALHPVEILEMATR